MWRRKTLAGIALAFLAAAAAIATFSWTESTHSTSRPPSLWRYGRQSLPARVEASPVDENMSEDFKILLGSYSVADADAHVPLRRSDGAVVEAGIKSSGERCYDVSIPEGVPAGACGVTIPADEVSSSIYYAAGQSSVFAGLAGNKVAGLEVLTNHGKLKGTFENGAFYIPVPESLKIRGWIIKLADGSQKKVRWPNASSEGS